MMELNRNPENYFAEVEQAAFNPANIVPGHRLHPRQDAAVPDLLLCRRAPLPARRELTSSLPVNRPRCPVHSYHRDGAMRFDGNGGGTRQLRAQQLRRSGGGSALQGAAAADLRRRRPLRPPRGQRRLRPGRRAVPPDERPRRSSSCSTTSPPPCRACRSRSSCARSVTSSRPTGLRSRRRRTSRPHGEAGGRRIGRVCSSRSAASDSRARPDQIRDSHLRARRLPLGAERQR